MKKVAIVMAAVLAAGSMFGLCRVEKVTEPVEGFIANSQETVETDSIEAVRDPMLPEIDTELMIEPGMRVAVVSMATKGEFWSSVQKGMEAAIQDLNAIYGLEKENKITMTFEGSDTVEDVEGQINILDAVIAENPNVICISAGDMSSCQAQLEAAAENDIPVIAFDSSVISEEHISAYRGTDNEKIGTMAAEKMVKELGGKGKIAIFSAHERTSSVKERVESFQKIISEYEIEIAEVIYQDQVEDMTVAMEEFLEKNQDLDGVFCTNATVSDLYLAIEKSEEYSAVMIGVDATKAQQQAVKDGKELGIVSQNPYAVGYQTIYTAVQTAQPEKQKEMEKNLLLEPAWIDAGNIESTEYSNYIYK